MTRKAKIKNNILIPIKNSEKPMKFNHRIMNCKTSCNVTMCIRIHIKSNKKVIRCSVNSSYSTNVFISFNDEATELTKFNSKKPELSNFYFTSAA